MPQVLPQAPYEAEWGGTYLYSSQEDQNLKGTLGDKFIASLCCMTLF